MNNKRKFSKLYMNIYVLIGLLLTIFLSNQALAAKTLAVPNVDQGTTTQTNWCWAATSQAVLSYTGNAPGMCTIADWARGQNGWGNDNCCTNGTGAICNQPNAMWGAAGSIQNILSHYGADSDSYGRSLNLTEVTKAIDDDSPIFVRWGWTAGGGHFVVLRGYNGSDMDIMDPWGGVSNILSHSNLTSTAQRTWTHTLIVKPKKITFVVDDTGSMWDDIDAVKSTLHNQISQLKTDGKFVKYALVTYKDNVNFIGTTLKHDEIDTWVSGLSADGGGDCPEEGYGALDMAADKAKNSEVWWMTDADSHGGFTRMLSSRARLLLAGNTLHSTILGSCSGGFAAAASITAPSQPRISSQDDSVPYSGATNQPLGLLFSALAIESDLNAFTAGENLSGGTGGLFFAVTGATIQKATDAVLEEMLSTALIQRLKLSAGNHDTSVPVDESVTEIKFLINIPSSGTGTLTVKDPDGVTLNAGAPGIEEIVAGDSRMLLVKAPALKKGTYVISSFSDLEYLLSVSGISNFGAELIGDTTAGVGKTLPIQLTISSLSSPTGLAGPGPDGPGGIMPMVSLLPLNPPFNTMNLQFFIMGEDGTGQRAVTLFDDGLHNDKLPSDGIYGGTLVPDIGGKFRIGVTDGLSYYRVTKLLVVSGSVAVEAPDEVVVAPGTNFDHLFSVQNLGTATRTYDLVSTTSAGWENVGAIVTPLTIDPAATKTFNVPVTVPLSAVDGDSSTLTLSAVAQDDPSVIDSVSVKTTVWTGPLLQGLNPSTVQWNQELTLTGSGFGNDPGVGNRSTNLQNVTIAGQLVPDSNIIQWQNTLIKIRIPGSTNSGLITVTAGGIQSNSLELVVLPAPNQPPVVNAGPDVQGTIGTKVTLQGSANDPDNGPVPMTYVWTQTSGPAVTLTGANSLTPSYTPNASGTYVFSLMAYDGKDYSAPDTVTVTVSAANVPIRVVQPNGGEVWKVDRWQTIKWSVSPKLVLPKVPASIWLSKDAGGHWLPIGIDLKNSSSFTWKPGRLFVTSKALIKVCTLSNQKFPKPVCDVSDATFTIKK